MPTEVVVLELVTKGGGREWSVWPNAERDLAPLRVERTKYYGRYRVFIEGTDDIDTARAKLTAEMDRLRPNWRSNMYIVDLT